MHRVQRKELLLSFICKKSFHEMNNVLKFAQFHGISSTTARRDLKELEYEGLIKMSYGGINFLGLGEKVCNIDIKHRNLNFEKKMVIAKKANEIIHTNDVIFVGDGSTCELFISQIKKKVKILTNSLRILEFARQNPNIEYLLLFGGKLRERSQSFYGSFCEESLSLIHFNKVIFTASNIDNTGQIYKSNEEIARVELAALAKVHTKILLIDHTKLGHIGYFRYYSLDELTIIITDEPSIFNKFNFKVKVY